MSRFLEFAAGEDTVLNGGLLQHPMSHPLLRRRTVTVLLPAASYALVAAWSEPPVPHGADRNACWAECACSLLFVFSDFVIALGAEVNGVKDDCG